MKESDECVVAGDLAKAIVKLQDSIKIFPSDKVMLKLISMFIKDNNIVEAYKLISKLSALYPKREEILMLKNKLGKVLSNVGQSLECISYVSNELVSIVLPTYNREEQLKVALKSIIDQDYQNVEVVVVNDGGQSVEGLVKTQWKELTCLISMLILRNHKACRLRVIKHCLF